MIILININKNNNFIIIKLLNLNLIKLYNKFTLFFLIFIII